MATDWPILTIAECASDEPYSTQIGPFGKALTPEAYKPSGVPLLRGVNVNRGRFHDDDYVFISEEDADRLSKFESFPGDVLLVHKGTLGPIGLMPENRRYARYIMGNSMMRVRCNRSKLLPDYLRYWLMSPAGQGYLLSRVSQVGVPQLQRPLTTLREAALPVPPVTVQENIVSVLGVLDDKVEQNQRTGRALEELARATFKAWFVDFEPVKAKAAGATSFPGMPPAAFDALPDRLTDSPLGLVPEGWDVKKAGDLASFILGGDWGKDAPNNETPDAACCIRGADIPNLWANGIGKMPVRFLKRGSLEKRSLRNGDIVVEISGGSPTQSTGRPVLVSDALLGQLPYPLVYSNFCRLFRPRRRLSNYTYFLFRWMYDTEQFLQYENGTTGIKNFAFTKFCEVHAVIEPPVATLAVFDTVVTPVMDLMAHHGSESRKLAALRNYLLPRLLSGRVRVRPSQAEAEG